MKLSESTTPVAAILTALSTLACCLPVGFLGAAGLASLGIWIQPFRVWFLLGAVLLLVVGFLQLYRRRDQCRKRSPISVALFWAATLIVLLTILFPQVIASLLAG